MPTGRRPGPARLPGPARGESEAGTGRGPADSSSHRRGDSPAGAAALRGRLWPRRPACGAPSRPHAAPRLLPALRSDRRRAAELGVSLSVSVSLFLCPSPYNALPFKKTSFWGAWVAQLLSVCLWLRT